MSLLLRLGLTLGLLSLLPGCSRARPQVTAEKPAALRPPEAPAPTPSAAPPHQDHERYTLTSPDGALRVEVESSRETGTMHHAARLRIHHDGQTIERVSQVDERTTRMAPLVDRIVPLAAGRYLLLGWASHGAGQQQDHALLLDASPGKLELLDELTLSTHRSRAALFVRTGSAPAIGVPGDTADLSEAEVWSLDTRRSELDVAQFRSLEGAFTSTRAAHVMRYAPPFHQPSPEERSVVWLALDARSIRLPEVLADANEHLRASLSSEQFHLPERDRWLDLDDDGQRDVLRCIGDGCMASPCVEYMVYLHRPRGARFAGTIPGNLARGQVQRLEPRHDGLHALETEDGTSRYRFERGRYRLFEHRTCAPESGECSPWKIVAE